MRTRTPLTAQPDYSAGATHYLFPADFATIYDLNPLFTAGTNGTGSSIAIAARSNIGSAMWKHSVPWPVWQRTTPR
jgi:subtilase family serine protease